MRGSMSDIQTSPQAPDAARRQSIEAQFVRLRLAELSARPPDPTFDEAHLKTIHERLFQDLPSKGINDHDPGRYRPPAGDTADWIKHRQLETVPTQLYVPYSAMDDRAREELRGATTEINPYRLRSLSPDHFASDIAATYARLDYLHPFREGNSRTLRTFFTQLAEECDYKLDWTKLAATPQLRDQLYVARDVEVIRLALPSLRSEHTIKLATATLDRLAGNPSLEKLVLSITRPMRALAFEELPASIASARYPELRPVYDSLAQADETMHTKFSPGSEVLGRFSSMMRSAIQKHLDQGRVLTAREIEIPITVLQRDERTSRVRSEGER